MNEVDKIRVKYDLIKGLLSERTRRIWAAVEAQAIGRGGLTIVHTATRLAKSTISRGINELNMPADDTLHSSGGRVRRSGGGRKKHEDVHDKLTIFWNSASTAPDYDELQVFDQGSSESDITYSCIQEGTDGNSNIFEYPVFVSHLSVLGADNTFATIDDGLKLQSQSPCIGTGDPSVAPAKDVIGNDLSADSVEMGAYKAEFPPVSIGLSNNYVQEAVADRNIGVLTAYPETTESRTYSVLSSTDFDIGVDGVTLKTISANLLAANSPYEITVRVVDGKGRSFDQPFSITVGSTVVAEGEGGEEQGGTEEDEIEQFVLVGGESGTGSNQNYYYSGGSSNIFKVKFDGFGENDQFGHSVAIDEDYAVVGAPYDDDAATDAGAVYIFKNVDSNWDVIKLIPSHNNMDFTNSKFGSSVAISGDIITVGAPGYSTDTGVALVYQRDFGGTDNWGLIAALNAPDADNNDKFGTVVACTEAMAVISAPHNQIGADTSAGSVYVFNTFDSAAKTATLRKQLQSSSPTTDQMFGNRIAVDASAIAVGDGDDSTSSAKSVYIFSKDEGGANSWGQTGTRQFNQASSFGLSVELLSTQVIVGLHSGIDQQLFIYEQTDLTTEVTTITVPDGETGDNFGYSTSFSGDVIVVGDPAISVSDLGRIYIYNTDGTQLETNGVYAAPLDEDDKYSHSIDGTTSWFVVGAPGDDVNAVNSGAVYFIQR